MRRARRKYLPAEGYRFLVLQLLDRRGPRGASKGEIAWETRANHYMATRVLGELAQAGWVDVDGDTEKGFVVRITREGGRLLIANREYWQRIFDGVLREHFRYGKTPDWYSAAP